MDAVNVGGGDGVAAVATATWQGTRDRFSKYNHSQSASAEAVPHTTAARLSAQPNLAVTQLACTVKHAIRNKDYS